MVVFYFVLDMAITNSYIYLGLLGCKRTKAHRPMVRIKREKLAIRLAFGDGILAPSKTGSASYPKKISNACVNAIVRSRGVARY